ncbi:uncharacterized protein LOC132562201 [Ylistrum balloti]|uniref:uncharacterized protein LOC132562201 n=1 Tax=Ylistrum balloti TaxID=509963 RepID=UPI002905F390|nr:uncharacterized protein LOC132562201 [Ylistrum balloti]
MEWYSISYQAYEVVQHQLSIYQAYGVIEMRADSDTYSCNYGYNIPIINMKSNTKMSGRRTQAVAHTSQAGVQIRDCYDEVQIYQIRLPFTTTNCSHKKHVTHKDTCDGQTKKRRKRERSHLKRSKRHKLSLDVPRFDPDLTDLNDMRDVEEECLKKEERRKSIREKLERGQEYLFTKLEERDIHDRAEIYSMSVSPDEDYYVPPDEQNSDTIILTTNGRNRHRSFQLPKKRKRRNYMSDSVFLTYRSECDPYDNSHKLPLGSKLIRPPDKLVELVGQAIDGSPDGLLQVPQIYTVVQNRYPFFRYMDRSALSSWRSSIRHALYQKWFRKIRFGTHAINTKGCYWANNHTYVPVNRKEETSYRRNKPLIDCEQQSRTENQGSEKHHFDDFDLDPDTHDKVRALLTEEKEKEKDLPEDYGNIEDVVCIAKEYGISLAEYGPLLGMDDTSKSSKNDTVPSPVRDPDPILSTCGRDPDPILSTCGVDWQMSTKDRMLTSFGSKQVLTSPAVLPTTSLEWNEQQRAVHSITYPLSSSAASHTCFGLTSPVQFSAKSDILRMDYRWDNPGGLLSDPGMGPASQSSDGYQFSNDPCEPPISFDIEQLPEMYNSDMFMPENYFSELS